MNVLIRCVEAAEKSTQRICKNPGDWYSNQSAAAAVWAGALRAFDESSEATRADYPGTREYMAARVEAFRNVGD